MLIPQVAQSAQEPNLDILTDGIPPAKDYRQIDLVYNFFPLKKSACRYYRIEVPFRVIGELGYSNAVQDPGGHNEESMTVFSSADIAVWYGIAGDGLVGGINAMRGRYADKIRHVLPDYIPPAMIFDTDDNNDWVHPLSPAYVTLGTRDYGGNLLKPGDSVYTTLPDGSPILLWQDKVTVGDQDLVFDIERNLKFNDSAKRTIQLSDGMTASCKFLADYYSKSLGRDDIYVFPNSVLPEDIPQVNFKERADIRIFWQGGASHAVDLFPLKTAFEHIVQKYPQVKIIMWGMEYPWILRDIPQDRVEIIDWVPYEAYTSRRVLMDVDINLCPLTDNVFARSKSAIKWYEGSLLAQPEVTLASKVGPYADEMVDGETGMLYSTIEEFVEKIGVLITNRELRQTLGANARKWVLTNRDARKTVPGLFDYYREVRRKQVLSFGV